MLFSIDFFNFNKDGSKLKTKYFKKLKELGQDSEKEIESEIKETKYQSRGGMILCYPNGHKVFSPQLNKCLNSQNSNIYTSNYIIEYNNNYCQCSSNNF